MGWRTGKVKHFCFTIFYQLMKFMLLYTFWYTVFKNYGIENAISLTCCFWITFFTAGNYWNFFKRCLVIFNSSCFISWGWWLFYYGFTRASSMVRRCDLKSIPFNLINFVRTWSGAVIKAKPLVKLDLERTIFMQQFSLKYVVWGSFISQMEWAPFESFFRANRAVLKH